MLSRSHGLLTEIHGVVDESDSVKQRVLATTRSFRVVVGLLPSTSPHNGKWRISSVRRASAGQPGTPTDMLSLFRSFIFASLPLSHAVTPPDATHGPLATP
uniref:Uncharacterized protein n=1 Tax=Fagus sylvatica TaxID=28930 RepID=A0A2N9G7D3_FAGSY